MNKAEIGETLENRRKTLKITQTQLANLTDVSVKTIVQLESGKGNPTLGVLIKVCEVLGLRIDIKAIKADD